MKLIIRWPLAVSAVLVAAFTVGLLLVMSAAGVQPAGASCKPSVSVSHSSTAVTADIDASCGMRVAAYGNAKATGYRHGSFKPSGDSVACVSSGCTEGGGWFSGGWERLGGHVEHCTFGCAVHTTALARRCTSTYDFGLGLHNDENGGQADWETNGCHFTMQTRVQCGNYLTGASYYHKSGEVSGTEKDAWAACNFSDYEVDFWIDPKDTNHWVDV